MIAKIVIMMMMMMMVICVFLRGGDQINQMNPIGQKR